MVTSVAVAAQRQQVLFEDGPMVRIEGLTIGQVASVTKMLTIPNPEKAKWKRFSGGWGSFDGPSTLMGYAYAGDGTLLVAPGAAAQVWRWLGEGVPKSFVYTRSFPDVIPAFAYTGEDRDYQVDSVGALMTRRQAVAVGPCGSGKTHIGARIIAHRNKPTLILVHTGDLAEQWKARVLEYLGVEAVVYRGRKTKMVGDEPIIIATIQGIRANPEVLPELRRTRGTVLVDECHHTPAAMFVEVLSQLQPQYRYGFTATPDRADGTTELMHWWIGPVLASIGRVELLESGHILQPELRVIRTDFAAQYDPDEPGFMNRLKAKMWADNDRLNVVCRALYESLKTNAGSHLVLSDSVPYGQAILERMEDAVGVQPLFIHGALGKAARRAIFAEVQSGRCMVLIATTLADEGLDLPILSVGFNVTPSSSKSRAEQRIGRICRPYPGKSSPIWFDVVDPNVVHLEETRDELGRPVTKVHRLFVNQFRSRLTAYRKCKATYDETQIRDILQGDPHVHPRRGL